MEHDCWLTGASQRRFNSGKLRRSLGDRSGSGFQPAMIRTHSRAAAVSATPGNSRRSSMAADSSPPQSNAAALESIAV